MPFQGTRGAGSSKAFGLGGKTKPNAPTIGTATDQGSGRAFNNGQASITFTPPVYNGQSTITSYTATASPGGYTGSATSSPIIVTGLQSSTQYTYSVTATNDMGISPASSASNLLTATTVPQAPTIGTVTDGGTGTTVSIPYTAGATGGSAITNYQFISNPATTTQTSTSNPYTFTGLTAGTAYTFTVAAINSNGTSTASSASNSVTPIVPTAFDSIATFTGNGTTGTCTFSSIPSTYKALQIRILAKDSTASASTIVLAFNFNGDTASNYTFHAMYGTGTTPGSFANSSNSSSNVNASSVGSTTASTFGASLIDILDYASTSKNKTMKVLSGVDSNGVTNGNNIQLTSGLWMNTSAIHTIRIQSQGNFTSGTSIALYGVK